MKKPMLNAIQKARMSMAMKSKNPKMNPGFDSLPKDVQAKIMNKRKPKLSAKKKAGGSFDKPLSEKRKEGLKKRKAIIKKVRKAGEAKVSASIKPKMAMKKAKMGMKKTKMGMKKAKASQTAGAIMKRERLMI